MAKKIVKKEVKWKKPFVPFRAKGKEEAKVVTKKGDWGKMAMARKWRLKK